MRRRRKLRARRMRRLRKYEREALKDYRYAQRSMGVKFRLKRKGTWGRWLQDRRDLTGAEEMSKYLLD